MKKAVAFYAKLNKESNTLKEYAKNIRVQKNTVSNIVCQNPYITYKDYNNHLLNLLFFHNQLSENGFVAIMKCYKVDGLCDSTAYQQACRQVYINYKQRFANIHYKKDKNDSDEIQEVKKFLYEHPKETLQEYKEYLSYLITNIDKYKQLHLNVLKNCLQELNNVFSTIHQLHLDYLNDLKANEYKSLTFTNVNVLTQPSGCEEIANTFQVNGKYINITINIPNIGKYVFKCKNHNKFYNIDDLKHSYRYKTVKNKKIINQVTISYSIKFINDKTIKIIFFKDDEEYEKPFYSTKEKSIGIDLNTKHNFLQCSDGKSFNYDDYIIKKEKGLRHYLKKIANNKSKKHNQKHSKKAKKREEKQARRRLAHANTKASELKDYCLQNDIKRVVFEDLNISLKTPKKLKKNQDFLQNHKQIALLFNDFKNVAKRILNKADIEVDFVNPRYTSKTCPICGCIEDANRPTQEIFHCVRCNHIDNADVNASINILERIIIDDLREELEYYSKKEKMYKGKDYKNKVSYQKLYSKVKQTA